MLLLLLLFLDIIFWWWQLWWWWWLWGICLWLLMLAVCAVGSNLLQSPMSAATNVIHQDGETEYGSEKKDKKRERWLLHLPVPKWKRQTNKNNQPKKEQKHKQNVNVCLCTFLCQNGLCEDDSTSFGENTICPDIGKKKGAQMYLSIKHIYF